jgi:hypothetical protein
LEEAMVDGSDTMKEPEAKAENTKKKDAKIQRKKKKNFVNELSIFFWLILSEFYYKIYS